jgi:hypothetical protein
VPSGSSPCRAGFAGIDKPGELKRNLNREEEVDELDGVGHPHKEAL